MKEEDIKILESECYYLEELGYLRENNHFIRFNQALENLIKGYRILELENQALQNTKDTCPNMATSGIRCDIKSNYIPKSKIKEKIEELEKYIYKGENAPQDFLQYRIKAKIQVLNELMEDK